MFSETNISYDGRKPIDIKKYNSKLVLSLLRQKPETTMTEISDQTSLSKTTISKIFSRLSSKGIIIPTGFGNSTAEGGKRPVTFSLCPDYCYSILISASFTDHITCTVINLTGQQCYRKRLETDNNLNYNDVIGIIRDMILEAVNTINLLPEKISGIAILYDGIIDSINGSIIHSAYHNWNGPLHICDDLRKMLPFDATIVIDNASNFSGYAELISCDQTPGNKMVIIWDENRTMGYCMLSGGRFVSNTEGISGGFAHVILDPSSSISCQCGAHGCLQSLLSMEAVLDYVTRTWNKHPESPISEKYLNNTLSISDMFCFSREGDPYALDLLSHVVRYFSILIHNMFSLYSVQDVILQGMFSLSGNIFLDQLKEDLSNFNKLTIYKNINVSYSQYNFQQPLNGINPYHMGANMYLSDSFIDTKL